MNVDYSSVDRKRKRSNRHKYDSSHTSNELHFEQNRSRKKSSKHKWRKPIEVGASSINNLIEEGLRMQREKAQKEEESGIKFSQMDIVNDQEQAIGLPLSNKTMHKQLPWDSTITMLHNHCAFGHTRISALHFFKTPRYQDWTWDSYCQLALPYMRTSAIRTVYDTQLLDYFAFQENGKFRDISVSSCGSLLLHSNDGRMHIKASTRENVSPLVGNSIIQDACFVRVPTEVVPLSVNVVAILTEEARDGLYNTVTKVSLRHIHSLERWDEVDVNVWDSSRQEIGKFYHFDNIIQSAGSDDNRSLLLYGQKDIAVLPLDGSSSGPRLLMRILPGSNLAVRTVQTSIASVSFVGMRNGSVLRLDHRESQPGSLVLKPREDVPDRLMIGQMPFSIDYVQQLQQTHALLVRDLTGSVSIWDLRRSSTQGSPATARSVGKLMDAKQPYLVNQIVVGNEKFLQESRFFVSCDQRVLLCASSQSSPSATVKAYDLRRAWFGSRETIQNTNVPSKRINQTFASKNKGEVDASCTASFLLGQIPLVDTSFDSNFADTISSPQMENWKVVFAKPTARRSSDNAVGFDDAVMLVQREPREMLGLSSRPIRHRQRIVILGPHSSGTQHAF
jgi:hypothetical protein